MKVQVCIKINTQHPYMAQKINSLPHQIMPHDILLAKLT